MTLLALPKNPTPAQLKDALEASAARIAQLESAAGPLAERVTELEERLALNVEAIRAMLTVLHPDPTHDVVDDDPLLGPFHQLVMRWIEAYGRDTDVPTVPAT